MSRDNSSLAKRPGVAAPSLADLKDLELTLRELD